MRKFLTSACRVGWTFVASLARRKLRVVRCQFVYRINAQSNSSRGQLPHHARLVRKTIFLADVLRDRFFCGFFSLIFRRFTPHQCFYFSRCSLVRPFNPLSTRFYLLAQQTNVNVFIVIFFKIILTEARLFMRMFSSSSTLTPISESCENFHHRGFFRSCTRKVFFFFSEKSIFISVEVGAEDESVELRALALDNENIKTRIVGLCRKMLFFLRGKKEKRLVWYSPSREFFIIFPFTNSLFDSVNYSNLNISVRSGKLVDKKFIFLFLARLNKKFE